MGLESVKEELLSNAKEQSDSLIAEARKEAGRIMKEAGKKIEEMKEKSDIAAKKAMDAVKRQELSSAELECKKMSLEAKKQAIQNAFNEAKSRLENLDDKKREKYIKSLLEKVKKDIEVSYIYCSKKDVKFLKGSNCETASIIGGIIAENKDKTIRVDYSFETMLDTIKEDKLQEINKMLFG